jgi:hypothetical protein
MLMYNRENFRDANRGKPKEIARSLYAQISTQKKSKYIEYLANKAVKIVKRLNIEHNFGLSEVDGDMEPATETHHIFPVAGFPQIAHFSENLINLTPNQHRIVAHPYGDFSSVDMEYQKICLIAKVRTIKKFIDNGWGCYDFESLVFVINTGYNTDSFSKIDCDDFDGLICLINCMPR